jgi:uncharacterized protein (DUF305 family)
MPNPDLGNPPAGRPFAWPRNPVVLAYLAVIVLAFVAASCRTANAGAGHAPLVQPGAPGEAPHPISPEKAADLSSVQYTPADVKFMQGMIAHHAQALEMTALLYSRTTRDDMRALAKRIDLSQEDEIKMMQHWLQVRGQPLPDPHAHHMNGAVLMPGMLTQEEMDRLAAATGDEFDRLFLEGMIKHHAGALTMVQELFATRGAGQEVEIFSFASDVDADQRMEIDRMGAMLNAVKERQR